MGRQDCRFLLALRIHARIADGLVDEGKERHRMDLLEKFLNSDSVLIL